MTGPTIITALLLAQASPQPPCGPFRAFTAELGKSYGEVPAARGLVKNGQVFVLMANPETGTWTALVVTPAGVACGIGAGTGYELAKPKPEGTPS